MKKIIVFVLAACLMFTVAACGSTQSAAPQPTEAPIATEAPAKTEAPQPTETPASEPEKVEPTPEPVVDETDWVAIASEYIDRPVEELYEAIGTPESSDYAPSCLGPGEDGNLYYDGFIVYTYREGNVETVQFVE